jgi:D-xylose transport system substrate-binding protein
VPGAPQRALVAVATAALVFGAAACAKSNNSSSSSSSSPTTGSGGGHKSGTVALLLPETKTARYEAHDRPEFVAKLKELCPDCKVIYSNANQDAATQQNQADQALTNGAKVLVLDPVDSASAATIVAKANQQNVPVISYDRLITGANVDYYVSFDNVQVGKLQGQALLNRLTQLGTINKGKVVWINGSPTDNNAKLFKQGAHSVLDGKVQIGREFDTPDWSPDKAQNEMQQAITALGKDAIVGVYAANDGTAGGAIAAMKSAGFTTMPPVTGQDAELAGIQRILAGDQYMTVYKATKKETAAAAQLAFDLLQGKKGTTNGTTNNGMKDVPSVLLTPVAVTKDNIKSTVVADGFWKVSDICTGQFAQACSAAGLS